MRVTASKANLIHKFTLFYQSDLALIEFITTKIKHLLRQLRHLTYLIFL